MTTYTTELNIGLANQLDIDYEIYNGAPTITEEEKAFIIETVLEALVESKEFEENLNQHGQDIEDGRGDYEYDRQKDARAESEWESRD